MTDEWIKVSCDSLDLQTHGKSHQYAGRLISLDIKATFCGPHILPFLWEGLKPLCGCPLVELWMDFFPPDIIYENEISQLIGMIRRFHLATEAHPPCQLTNLFTWPQHLSSHKSVELLCFCLLAVFATCASPCAVLCSCLFACFAHPCAFCVRPSPVCAFWNISSLRRIEGFLIRGVPHTFITAAVWIPGDFRTEAALCTLIMAILSPSHLLVLISLCRQPGALCISLYLFLWLCVCVCFISNTDKFKCLW